MTVLVAYYSRTNITKKVAEEIAEKLNADIEEINPKVNYKGKIGYVRGGKDALSEKIIDLEQIKHDPSNYEIVYLGAPVWAGKSATPMISYIKENEGKFNNVKFFATAGSSGFESTFEQMEKFVGKAAQKTLALTTKEVKKGEYSAKLESFLE